MLSNAHATELHISQHIASEPGVIDTGLDMLSSFVSRVLSGLPDLNSVDLSMDKVKGKGQ